MSAINASPRAQNEAFISQFSDNIDNFRAKFAAASSDFVKDHIREDSFCPKILPHVTVTRDDLQVSVNHDTLVKIVSTEPRTRAASMSFRAQPEVVYYTAPRFEVAFFEVGSPRYEQTKQELLAYDFPITDFIKKSIVMDIGAIKDRILVNYSEQAVQSMQQAAQSLVFGAVYADTAAFSAFNVNAGTAYEVGKIKGVDVLQNCAAANASDGLDEDLYYPPQKDDFIKLRKLFPGYGGTQGVSYGRLRCEQLLITETDEADLAGWTFADVGDTIAGETAREGWKGDKVVGMRYVRTLKTDILRPGVIYAYAGQDFLGKWMTLNKMEFWADRERNRFSFEAYEDCGTYLGNVAAVRKCELFAGAVENVTTPADNASIRTRYLPVSEKDLGKLNNLVAEGITVPNLSAF